MIALLTDFGTADGFPSAMKGVIATINPGVPVVDITHEVEPFNILEGALLLKAHYRYFPKGTIFIAVVDPGVGSERFPIALRCGDYLFVAPYNGILDLVISDIKRPPSAVVLENKDLQLPSPNNTFHGRDVFAPAGAYLSKGVPLNAFGRSLNYTPKLNIPQPIREGRAIRGKIIHFDRFGNAITNLPCGDYSHGEFRGSEIKVVPYFQAGEKGKLSLVCGSFGFMELFTPMGNALEKFALRKGEEVILWKL